MPYTTSSPWLEHLIQYAMVLRSGRSSEFYRAVRAGRFLRLAEGVYLPATFWAELSDDDRFRASIHAAALASRDGVVFSHMSAAALWRLPLVGVWPSKPEVTVGREASGVTRRAFTARQYPFPTSTDSIDGLAATSLTRTLIDVGRTRHLTTSVAMMDHALAAKPRTALGLAAATVTRNDLEGETAHASSQRGMSRCRAAFKLADGRSGSAGESLSRVGIFLLALPAPILQQEFRDSEGLIGIVDFWWPEYNLIGEFDGYGKYLREELLAGQSTADAVLAEKRREDRLRAVGPRVTRWDWNVARSLPLLGRHLRDAGLR